MECTLNMANKISSNAKLAVQYSKEAINKGIQVDETTAMFIESSLFALCFSSEDIDNAMRYGANHPIGPLALGDLIGLDVVLAIMDVLATEFGDLKYRAHPLLKKWLELGNLEEKLVKVFININ